MTNKERTANRMMAHLGESLFAYRERHTFLEEFRAGETMAQLANRYNLTVGQIEEAIRWATEEKKKR